MTGRDTSRSTCLDCGKTFDAEGTADLHGMTKGHAITSGREASSTTPVLDLMEQAIGESMVLRTSPREIAEAVLLALGCAGYRLTAPARETTATARDRAPD